MPPLTLNRAVSEASFGKDTPQNSDPVADDGDNESFGKNSNIKPVDIKSVSSAISGMSQIVKRQNYFQNFMTKFKVGI